MTDENVPSDQATTQPTQKPRSPIERAIVWGVILVLIGVAGYEAQAKWGYTGALASLKKGVNASDSGQDASDFLAADLDKSFTGMFTKSDPVSEGPNTSVTYQWKSLIREYQIKVIMTSENPEEPSVVLNYETPNAEPDPVPEIVNTGDTDEAGGMSPKMGFAGGPGGPGGAPSHDAEAGSSVAKEETPPAEPKTAAKPESDEKQAKKSEKKEKTASKEK